MADPGVVQVAVHTLLQRKSSDGALVPAHAAFGRGLVRALHTGALDTYHQQHTADAVFAERATKVLTDFQSAYTAIYDLPSPSPAAAGV